MFRCQYTIFREFKFVLAHLLIIKMIKYNIVVCGYGKVSVNVAAYVITG